MSKTGNMAHAWKLYQPHFSPLETPQVIGGTVNMVGTTFTATIVFASYYGVGLTIAVLSGVSTMTWCVIQMQSVVENAAATGATTFVGGGVQILTACDIRYVCPIASFAGAGAYATMAGMCAHLRAMFNA